MFQQPITPFHTLILPPTPRTLHRQLSPTHRSLPSLPLPLCNLLFNIYRLFKLVPGPPHKQLCPIPLFMTVRTTPIITMDTVIASIALAAPTTYETLEALPIRFWVAGASDVVTTRAGEIFPCKVFGPGFLGHANVIDVWGDDKAKVADDGDKDALRCAFVGQGWTSCKGVF